MDENILLQRLETGESGLPLGSSLYTAFLCILFGANAVAVKISLTGMGVFANAGLRFAVAAVVIFLWARITGKPLKINRTQLYQLLPLAVLFYAQLSFFYLGLNKTTASHGILISNALPFVVMLMAHYFIPGDTISLRKVLGLSLGFTGVLVLLADSLTLTGDVFQGDMFVLAAVLVWGANVICVKRLIEEYHPIQITLYPMLVAVPLFFLSSAIWDGAMIRFINVDIISALVYQTFVTASFGLVAWNSLVRKYGATVLHSFVFIMPISGVFFGVILLGDPLTTNLLFSILLVSTGLIIVHKKGRRGKGHSPRQKED